MHLGVVVAMTTDHKDKIPWGKGPCEDPLEKKTSMCVKLHCWCCTLEVDQRLSFKFNWFSK